ncbi:MAG: DUF5134 domain-containing protein [Propionicimonas sp.]|uniref:DUF5134 domain-containing protein n=1 Tax=Propionicimonas sp. TaxID=1955623 RepID=UPI002B1EE883|nr:DUF5134 domain-containing protein [Propionicimonas sp.]MEA4944668.1 DUF5134 domain-containing protein [Propionicimonas sp.]
MFSFATTPVMFVGLLVLFAWCCCWCGYELTRPQSGRQRVSNALHLLMSVVMLLMVAGPTWGALTTVLPTPVLAGIFVLATGWFGWLAIDAGRTSDRPSLLHFTGHATMFAAMSWHLAAMAVMTAGMTAAAPDSGMSGHGHGGHDGMDMGNWMTAESRPGGALWWFALVGLPLMAYLLAAALRALWLAARPAPAGEPVDPDTCDCDDDARHSVTSHNCHETRPAGSAKYRLAALSDFAMCAGMFWMSTGLLAPILPMLAVLAH